MNSQSLHVRIAKGFFGRLAGLLVLPRLQPCEGLYLAPCSSVHTAGMRYAIDVLFVNRERRVLKLVSHLRPWRVAACWEAHAAVELLAGEAARLEIQKGQVVEVHDTAGRAA